MEERKTVERRTTVVPDQADAVEDAGTTNINIDGGTGATTVQRNEPTQRETTVRETTVERTRET